VDTVFLSIGGGVGPSSRCPPNWPNLPGAPCCGGSPRAVSVPRSGCGPECRRQSGRIGDPRTPEVPSQVLPGRSQAESGWGYGRCRPHSRWFLRQLLEALGQASRSAARRRWRGDLLQVSAGRRSQLRWRRGIPSILPGTGRSNSPPPLFFVALRPPPPGGCGPVIPRLDWTGR